MTPARPPKNPTRVIYMVKTADGIVLGRMIHYITEHFFYPKKFAWSVEVNGVQKNFMEMEEAFVNIMARLHFYDDNNLRFEEEAY